MLDVGVLMPVAFKFELNKSAGFIIAVVVCSRELNILSKAEGQFAPSQTPQTEVCAYTNKTIQDYPHASPP